MTSAVVVTLIDGIQLNPGEEEGVVNVEAPRLGLTSRVTLKKVSPALKGALDKLQGGAEVAYLFAKVMTEDGPSAMAKLKHYLATLGRHGLIGQQLRIEDEPVASIEPSVGSQFRFDPSLASAEKKFLLSRFACTRKSEAEIVLESPLGHATVRLHSREAFLALFALTEARDAAGLSAEVEGLDENAALTFLNFLLNARAVQEVDAEGNTKETTDPALRTWSFHDLLFHSRSRMGRHSQPYGGTFRWKDQVPEVPPVRLPVSEDVHELPKPNLETLSSEDLPFTKVLEGRTSIRHQGQEPITKEQLGQFLYRAARVKKVVGETVSFRNAASGGATHSLEIWPLIENCEGLEKGLYNYDPLAHVLRRVSPPTPPLQTLAAIASSTAMLEQKSQVTLLISARFQRTQIKYESVAYSLILKDLGCLYQTMYLVATAMGLAPCALGGGHSDLFSAATGLPYLLETTVGEFLLGSQCNNPDHDHSAGTMSGAPKKAAD